MRSIDEQMEEILQRREVYQAVKAIRQKIILEGAVCGGCAALLIAVIAFLPRLHDISDQAEIRQYGSMVLKMPSVGYVLIALLAFIMGVAVILLCQHWKQKKEKEREI